MNCIIIDDELTARTIITQLISFQKDMTILEEFPNAIQAIKYLNHHQVDVIFLDIHMPDFSGIDFLQTIKKKPKIILVTSDRNFAVEAFDYDCIVDYLVKPISEDRFEKAIQKLKFSAPNSSTIESKQESIIPKDNAQEFYINIDRRLVKIDIQSVTIVEAKGDYILIKTEHKNYKVHSTLKKIEEKLPQEVFLKVHRSFVINTKKIIDIEDNSVLIGKDVIPVSRSNRPELMQRLNLL